MLDKKNWPFDLPNDYKLSPEDRRDFAFLGEAHRSGYQSYFTEGIALGAAASNGRDGDIVRRGGRGRYWEIVLSEADHIIGRRFVDGFEPAATAVLCWLRGEPYLAVCERIAGAIVRKPGERGW